MRAEHEEVDVMRFGIVKQGLSRASDQQRCLVRSEALDAGGVHELVEPFASFALQQLEPMSPRAPQAHADVRREAPRARSHVCDDQLRLRPDCQARGYAERMHGTGRKVRAHHDLVEATDVIFRDAEDRAVRAAYRLASDATE